MHLFVRHNRRLLGVGIPLAMAVLATATVTDGSATVPLAAAPAPANGVPAVLDHEPTVAEIDADVDTIQCRGRRGVSRSRLRPGRRRTASYAKP